MKKRIIFYSLALFVIIIGIIMFNIFTDNISIYEVIIFGTCITIFLMVSNFFFSPKKDYFWIYPLSLMFFYISYNVTYRVSFKNGEFKVNGSDPRYFLIFYYVGALAACYAISYLIDYVTHFKATKFIYLITDIVMTPAFFIIWFATIFSSPV